MVLWNRYMGWTAPRLAVNILALAGGTRPSRITALIEFLVQHFAADAVPRRHRNNTAAASLRFVAEIPVRPRCYRLERFTDHRPDPQSLP